MIKTLSIRPINMDMHHNQACGISCHGAASVIGQHADAHTSAHFFMYQYKVVLCPKRYSHDWGACPYAHEKEKARRRDPQTFQYSSCICPNASKSECPNGLQCPYAHTLFEYWLHPARFRKQMCRSGTDCRRALCFFAHTAEELRNPSRSRPADELPPLPSAAAVVPGPMLGMQQQQQARGLAGILPGAAAPHDMPCNGDDPSANSFTSSCSVVTAGGSSFLPMLPTPMASGADALYNQMPGAAGMAGSSSPLLMASSTGMLAPLQQQQVMMPANHAYLLQLQLQQQQDLQQQARLQALQLQLQQQQSNVRAALRGMEQQRGMGYAASSAMGSASNSFEGYPLAAFNSAPTGFPAAGAAAVAVQPGINYRISAGSAPGEDASASFVVLQDSLANSMANMSMGGGINFAGGTCVIGPDNSGSNALGVSESMLAAAGQQQQQQQRSSGVVESWL